MLQLEAPSFDWMPSLQERGEEKYNKGALLERLYVTVSPNFITPKPTPDM